MILSSAAVLVVKVSNINYQTLTFPLGLGTNNITSVWMPLLYICYSTVGRRSKLIDKVRGDVQFRLISILVNHFEFRFMFDMKLGDCLNMNGCCFFRGVASYWKLDSGSDSL